jgi:hypothetical protein
VLAHLFNRSLLFSETNADDVGRLSRRAHLTAPSMLRAGRDALALLSLCTVLAGWRIYLDPSFGVGTGDFDWRVHFVWLFPLLVAALAPWIFHPYIVGGRDLPRRASQHSLRAGGAPRVAPEPRERVVASRRGAA